MSKIAVRSALAASVLGLGTALGMGSAAAQPDLGAIPVQPNEVIDATAFTAEAPVMNPDGQPGVSTTFTHRDGTRQIKSTVLMLADAAAATGAIDAARSQANVVDAKTEPAAVGAGGTIVSGLSADRSQSVSVLTFTQGNAAATVRFSGPADDPVPGDLVLDYGQRQDAAIKAALAT
ncbi:hypothetical protein [Mycobacterium sp. 1274761.0]|uniref:hypothetical protein n=1 Tax=Mycobacterium sp. 1274761.0 TaxID=1834077 RepID=UPI000800F52C|nr:hypothetical protein [Mycobacterium sp. 1274761.0]OBK71154.1 hypothetical protein A5651_00980 [Mycobacterium sp. 1274761.0]